MASKGDNEIVIIEGDVDGKRLSSQAMEERIQAAIKNGGRKIKIIADGQHGLGGRIWPINEKIKIIIAGPSGQRVGSMGMAGTEIVVKENASDDVGWLNSGAKIIVLGDVTNGAHNAGAQGVLYVQGGGGARCDTMTKFNPRFEPLQSWYFRDVGDSFAEFKAGGIAVVCGVNPRNRDNILGYRPCVGMVGGIIYFRGPIRGYSDGDVKLSKLTPQDWEWLTTNMKPYLKAVDREKYYKELTKSVDEWQKLIPFTPAEKSERKSAGKPDMVAFRRNSWEADVGKGGIFGTYLEHDESVLPYITTGVERRFKPLWNNNKYSAPCAGACPSDIPTRERTGLIRRGELKRALELVLQYSPFPATVCGQICPNLCMDACTRGLYLDTSLDIKTFGTLSLDIAAPKPEPPTGKKVAVIGGGPGGLSAAWQLALKGHEVSIYEKADKLGGKVEFCIPRDRLPLEVLAKELSRFKEIGIKIHLGFEVDKEKFAKIYQDNEVVIVATGAYRTRIIPFAGSEDIIPGIEFLRGVNQGEPMDLEGQDIIIIGAGNVGMDIASQAYNQGAKSVTAVDIQPPASFGIEQEIAKKKGTKILYPKFTEKYDAEAKKIYFKDGTSLPADTVFISIGELPILDFLPPEINVERGLLDVDKLQQTTDVKVFAVGDATGAGLVTHAVGEGRRAAEAIHAQMMDYDYVPEVKAVIPYNRIRTAYYEAEREVGAATYEFKPEIEADRCLSCGACIDCKICLNICYQGAISRVDLGDCDWEYVVDAEKCTGCSFCAGTCPTGVWEMTENI